MALLCLAAGLSGWLARGVGNFVLGRSGPSRVALRSFLVWIRRYANTRSSDSTNCGASGKPSRATLWAKFPTPLYNSSCCLSLEAPSLRASK